MAHDHGDKSPSPSKGKKRPYAPKTDPQNDPDLRIIDSWDHNDSDDGNPPKRKPDPQDDDGLRVIDSYDTPRPKTHLRDYKSMYKNVSRTKNE